MILGIAGGTDWCDGHLVGRGTLGLVTVDRLAYVIVGYVIIDVAVGVIGALYREAVTGVVDWPPGLVPRYRL